jgi:hypothetical protein
MTEAQLKARIAAERQIIRALCAHCIKVGFMLSYNDGEEWAVKLSRDLKAIMEHVGSTDEATITIRDNNGERIGGVSLVYGNDGYDVIADYTVNDQMEEIMHCIKPVIDKVENRLTR